MAIKEVSRAANYILAYVKANNWEFSGIHSAAAALSVYYSPELKNSSYSYGIEGTGDDRRIETTHSCHAKLQGALKYPFTEFSTAIYTGTPESEAFMNWIMDPKYSPWRKVVPEGSWAKIMHEDKWVGIEFLDTKVVNENPELFYNFLIASRQPAEYKPIVNSWFDIQKLDVYKADAYGLAHYFDTRSNWAKRSLMDGGHKPLSNYYQPYFNPVKFRRGEYDPKKATTSRANAGWNDLATSVYYNLGNVKVEEVKTKFSTLSVVNPDNIIEVYKKSLKEITNA